MGVTSIMGECANCRRCESNCFIIGLIHCKECEFLKLQDNKNIAQEQLNQVISNLIVKPYCATRLLLNFKHILTEDQIFNARKTILKDIYATYIGVLNGSNIPQSIRNRAINKIMCSIFYTKRFLLNCNPTNQEKIYIVSKFINNPQFLSFYLSNFNKYDVMRNCVFKHFLFYPNELFQFLVNFELSFNELQRVYKKYGTYFYNKTKRYFNKYFTYCKIFNQFIPDSQRQKLCNMLLKKCESIGEALNFISFNPKQYRLLQRYQKKIDA
jgi:hypothetical protein